MSNTLKPLRPKVVLAVGAHPDDSDVSASGSLSKYASMGAKVYYLILTDGRNGSSDKSISQEELMEARIKEQSNAAKAVGAETPIFLSFPDGGLEPTLEVKKEIVKVIRRTKPDLVITMDPLMFYSPGRGMINHPDHRAAGEATLAAVFPLARDHLAYPDLIKEGLMEHRVSHVLLTSFDGGDYAEDISKFIDHKIKALMAHSSQFGDGKGVAERIKQWNKTTGATHGYDYAETFKRIDLAY